MGGNPLTIKEIQKGITRTVYCGVLIHKWNGYQPIKAQYDGLVDIKTFNNANKGKIYIKEMGDGSLQALYDYHPEKIIFKRNKNNPLFPYKFILCPHCCNPFLASSPKGKSGRGFPTYHCNRDHKYLGINKKQFEGDIEDYLKKLKFSTGQLKAFGELLLMKYREKQKEITSHSSQVSKNISDLKAEQALLVDKLINLSSETAQKIMEEKIETLEAEIRDCQQHRDKIEVTERDIQNFVNNAKKLMEHPYEMLKDSQNLTKKQALFELVFEQTPTYHEFLNGTPKLSLAFEYSSTSKKTISSKARGAYASSNLFFGIRATHLHTFHTLSKRTLEII